MGPPSSSMVEISCSLYAGGEAGIGGGRPEGSKPFSNWTWQSRSMVPLVSSYGSGVRIGEGSEENWLSPDGET